MKAMPDDVAVAFSRLPPAINPTLMTIRALIFEVAVQSPVVGPLTEALRWGEPAYLTEQSRSGSTIRLGVSRAFPQDAAIFLNCQTTLIEQCREMFGDAFGYEGNRALLVAVDRPLPEEALRLAIGMALTYHRRPARTHAL